MAAPGLIQVAGLTKHFPVRRGPFGGHALGYVRAVDNVSFSLAEGQTFAIVGESGSGKTTTARIILRLEEPTDGHVIFDGKDVHELHGSDLKRYRMSVQAVFQDPWASLSPRMRVMGIVSEPMLVNQRMRKPAVRDRVAAVLQQVGLQPFQANLFPHEFSGGQRQRIALASALVTSPRWIILDEPLSALDVSARAQMIGLLKKIQREAGTGYLLIAHDLATVRYLADRVAVMYLGQIVEQAEAEELFSSPKHPYTQSLFASILPTHPDAQGRGEVPEGEEPNPLEPPTGCRFRTRCPFAMDICTTTPPAPRETASGHLVSCHLYP